MSHISYSEFKIWAECPYKHKLKYIDKVDEFKGNHYTAFGTAIHSVCEHKVLKEQINEEEHFEKVFFEELAKLPEDVTDQINQKTIDEMLVQGRQLSVLAYPFLEEYFEEYEVVSVEEQLYENIKEFEQNDIKFKGFIDLVVKTPDGKYHIIDWKTCSWGWHPKKKADSLTTYQLTFYKYYFAQKHNIDPKKIETYFGLLKRTAKKNHVEIFRVTSGPKKTENALNYLSKALHNINSNNFHKNKLSCTSGFGCEFYETEHCK